MTYSAPMSYVGSLRRLTGWGRRFHGWPAAGTWLLVVFAVLAMWAVVTAWYVVAFGIFGLFTIPFRFIRRGQRKQLHVAELQLEELRRTG